MTAAKDSNDVAAAAIAEGRDPQEALRERIAKERRTVPENLPPDSSEAVLLPNPYSVRDLVKTFPVLRPPVIHGLLRQGETMNVISASKMGKSWLTTALALCLATGRPWIGYETDPGSVLILDNELHGETIAGRIPKVAGALDIDFEAVADKVFVENLRGRLQNIFVMESYFRALRPEQYKLIVLDAFYRFLPRNSDENDNGTMANIYNAIDGYADYLRCSFVLIHHSTKGIQSGKAVTDVGAGAGAQSRATDTHLILRAHEEPNAVVLDAAVRSFPPVLPKCLRWTFPIWAPADDLDPALLKPERPRRPRKAEPAEHEVDPWTVEKFVTEFLGPQARAKKAVIAAAHQAGLTYKQAEGLLAQSVETGKVYSPNTAANRPQTFSTSKPPVSGSIQP